MTAAYVDPQSLHNPGTGGIPPASWGDAVRDDLEALAKMPGCSVVRSAALAVVNNTVTNIPFTATDLRDTDAYHSTVINSERMTVPSGLGGLYQLTAFASFAANATGFRQVGYAINGGAGVGRLALPNNGAGAALQCMFTDEFTLAAGDYVTVWVFQSSGGNLNVTGDAKLRMVAVS